MNRTRALKKITQILAVELRGNLKCRSSWLRWKFYEKIPRIMTMLKVIYMRFWRGADDKTVNRYYKILIIRSQKQQRELRLKYFKYLQWIGGIMDKKTIEYEKADYIAHKIVSLGFVLKTLPAYYKILRATPENIEK